jgi:hypothetical protein
VTVLKLVSLPLYDVSLEEVGIRKMLVKYPTSGRYLRKPCKKDYVRLSKGHTDAELNSTGYLLFLPT